MMHRESSGSEFEAYREAKLAEIKKIADNIKEEKILEEEAILKGDDTFGLMGEDESLKDPEIFKNIPVLTMIDLAKVGAIPETSLKAIPTRSDKSKPIFLDPLSRQELDQLIKLNSFGSGTVEIQAEAVYYARKSQPKSTRPKKTGDQLLLETFLRNYRGEYQVDEMLAPAEQEGYKSYLNELVLKTERAARKLTEHEISTIPFGELCDYALQGGITFDDLENIGRVMNSYERHILEAMVEVFEDRLSFAATLQVKRKNR